MSDTDRIPALIAALADAKKHITEQAVVINELCEKLARVNPKAQKKETA